MKVQKGATEETGHRVAGRLYVVATPIGNLEDITLRAIDTLKNVGLIAAEDTRRTGLLRKRYGIGTPLTSFFEHNKEKKAEQLIERLEEAKDIALVSDAGTPGISDPGFYLIRLAIQRDIEVVFIPGPTASIAALVLSGMPTDRFVFEGFLPSRSTARRKRLEVLAEEKRTIIFYESPYRLLKTLNDIREIFGERRMSVSRELTKKFEETRRGTAGELIEYFQSGKVRGEFVLVVEGKREAR